MSAQSRFPATNNITLQTFLPELMRTHPQTREVFNQYGLRGCGGAAGPVETIQTFARIHGVAEEELLEELSVAAAQPETSDISQRERSVADTIYRRYFTAGIVVILTFGATWGAWLLWRIGASGRFTGVSIHEVNAHGHAQIFGWVGLFIMGFAYQALPRFWHVELAAPGWSAGVFISMVAGLILRTIGMALAGQSDIALSLAMIGAMVELAAIVVFVIQIVVTWRGSHNTMEPYVGFIVMALAWLVAMAVFDAWHTYTTMTAANREQLLWYISAYQAPLRDIQIHGLALFMILGVSSRMLPAIYGVPSATPRRLWIALGMLTVAVAGECAIFVAFRWTGNHLFAAMLMIPWIMLAVGVALVALPWKLWRRIENSDRSAKFIRTAYCWLAISLAMLLLLPVYQAVSGIPFSHAYYGAIRHAITVGFISLMIMGFASKVAPTLNGVDVRQLSSLWGPYLLVNVGCLLRVSTQTLTDWHSGFFTIIGLSGTLEVIGLAWWGAGLIHIMRRGKSEMEEQDQAKSRPERITASHHVADIVEWYPATFGVFDHYGFTLLRNPFLRRTVARGTTIAQAASFRRIDLNDLLDALNTAIGQSPDDGVTRKHLSLDALTRFGPRWMV
jgi:hypothetical protein